MTLTVLVATVAILTPVYAQGYITAVSAQASSAQVHSASATITDAGLTETAPGSGIFQLSTNRFAGGGAMWSSGFVYYGGDENAYIEFDLGQNYTVDRFRIWNYNESGFTFRGFKEVTVQYSQNGTVWQSLSQRFRFAQAPGLETYTGEEYPVTYPFNARYVRFIADSTHRNFPFVELAGLGKVRFHVGGVEMEEFGIGGETYPSDAGIINVKMPPYNAVGDGVADDTTAIENAIRDWQGTRQTIFIPTGAYRITRPIRLQNATGFGFTNIKGEGPFATTLFLDNYTFTDPNNPQPVLSAGFNGVVGGGLSADWFNVNFADFSINTGIGNPGAIGLQFYSNNVGSLRNVIIFSEDQGGTIGLDLAYADQNGPLLVKDVIIVGFATGINSGFNVNSLTLENVALYDQTTVGIKNVGQCLSIRNLTYEGNGPAVDNIAGLTTLIEARISGSGPNTGAIVNNEALLARNIEANGYAYSILNNFGGASSQISEWVSEFVSQTPITQFATRPKTLELPIEETPIPCRTDPEEWVNIRNYRLTTDPDDTLAVQRAIDSGAKVIYFPAQGTYRLGGKVIVRGQVEQVAGMHARILRTAPEGGFEVSIGASDTVWFDDLGNIGTLLNLTNASARTMVCRNMQDPNIFLQGPGKLFLENVATGPLTITGQQVWARQLNIEGSQTKVVNNGGTFWVLGFKSEAGGTLIETNNGGKSELLGGLYYSQDSGSAPMFINNNSFVSLSIGEVNFASNPFNLIVQETRGGVTRTLAKSQTPQRRFVPGSMLPLYVGYDDPTYLAPPYNVSAVGGVGQITLTWDALPNATSYIVERATAPGGPYTTLSSSVMTNSYTDTGLPNNTTYYYRLATVYPAGQSAFTDPVPAATQAIAVYRINSGGGAVGPFGADQFHIHGNVASTSNTIDTTGVINPAPQAVYQTERWGNFSYNITGLTPGASYKLRLHFAEFIVGGTNQRVFNVLVNGSAFLTNFDIIAETGGINRATVRDTTATADANGQIAVEIVSVVAFGKISGIEVLQP
jgi:hypothetical protein